MTIDKAIETLWSNPAVKKDTFELRYDEGYTRWILYIVGREPFEGKTPQSVFEQAVEYYKGKK